MMAVVVFIDGLEMVIRSGDVPCGSGGENGCRHGSGGWRGEGYRGKGGGVVDGKDEGKDGSKKMRQRWTTENKLM